MKKVTDPNLLAQLEGNTDLIERGNIDPSRQKLVPLGDGNYTTTLLHSMNVNIDGQEVLIPTTDETGREMPEQEAIDRFTRTGEHLGKFKTPQAAAAFGQHLSNEQEKKIRGGAKGKKVTDPAILAQLEQPQQSGVVQAVKNIPGSAARLGQAVAQPFLHPVETFTGLQRLVSGAAQQIPGVSEALDVARENLPGPLARQVGTREDIPIAESVGQFYADRFGSGESLRRTAIEDPVGLAADVAGVFGMAGAGLRAAGASRAANIAQTASKAVDPLFVAGKAATTVGRPTFTYATGLTTGSGQRAVEQAMKGGKAFTEAMRGKTTEFEVLDQAKGALDDIRQARSTEYISRLGRLKSATQQVNIDDIKKVSDDWLERYNVKKADGELDFSRSTVTGGGVNEVKSVYDMIQDWGSKAEDLTPAGLDILKRRIGSFFTQDRQSRAMVSSLEKAVKNKIVQEVPEYAEMVRGYEKASGVIKEIEQALALGKRSAADTALRKLMTAVREDKTFRKNLLDTLGQASGEDIMGSAAGLIMQPVATQRLIPAITAAGAGAATLTNPWLVPLLGLASPRVVGEFARALGALGRAAPFGRGTGILAYQTGRLPLTEAP